MINGELIEWRDTYIYGDQYQVRMKSEGRR